MTDDDVLVHMTIRLSMTWIDSRIDFQIKTNENLQLKSNENLELKSNESLQIKTNESPQTKTNENPHTRIKERILIGQPVPLTIEQRQLIW